MATRADYRSNLSSKLLSIEDSGYGDFDPSNDEMDDFISLSVSGLYPAVYKRVAQMGLTVATYGSDASRAAVDVAFPDRVFLVEDAEELTPVLGWQVRPTSLVGMDIFQGPSPTLTTVNVYYHDAFTLPDDDVTDVGLSAAYTPLVVLGALIECLESRHDTGVRPDISKGYEQVSLLDRLQRRYERLIEQKAMGLPPLTV